MKKTTILAAFVASAVLASNAFAVTSITSSTTIGGGVYSPSTNVMVKIISASTSYAATSGHTSGGTMEYGTLGGSGVTGDPTKIVSKSKAASDQPTDPASATALASGYQ